MADSSFVPPGIDFFWEQADLDESGEHPLEREISHRLDRMARYRAAMADAEAVGQDGRVDELARQHEREEGVVRRLRGVLEQRSAGDA